MRSAEHGHCRCEQAVVGADEHAVLDRDRDATPVGADPRIDHREHESFREVLHGAGERERAGTDVEGRNVVGDVDDAELRRDVGHDRVADADELVGAAVVGEERDELGARHHRPTLVDEWSERWDAACYPACV